MLTTVQLVQTLTIVATMASLWTLLVVLVVLRGRDWAWRDVGSAFNNVYQAQREMLNETQQISHEKTVDWMNALKDARPIVIGPNGSTPREPADDGFMRVVRDDTNQPSPRREADDDEERFIPPTEVGR